MSTPDELRNMEKRTSKLGKLTAGAVGSLAVIPALINSLGIFAVIFCAAICVVCTINIVRMIKKK